MRNGDLTSTPDLDAVFSDEYIRLVKHLSVAAGSRSVAEEAVQEAFIQAHTRWQQIAAYEDPVGWIRRVALNRIHNHRRGRRRLNAAIVRLAGNVPAGRDDASSWVRRADVARALMRLSIRQRTAATLYYLEGLDVEKTAAEMGISVGSVKTHLHRAREMLRPLLEEAP